MKVKGVRTDNGAEFLSFDCQKLFQNNGIIHQKTCPYTPQQNEVVEWKHRHVIQVARALLHHAGLPHRFWGEAVLTATYIINKLPTATLNWKCPTKILTNSPPDYSRLRVFGCLCYVTNVDPHKRKFDARAKRCIFLGYIANCKGFKVYDIQHHKILVSRDVKFYENIFPTRTHMSQEMFLSQLPFMILLYLNLSFHHHSRITPLLLMI